MRIRTNVDSSSPPGLYLLRHQGAGQPIPPGSQGRIDEQKSSQCRIEDHGDIATAFGCVAPPQNEHQDAQDLRNTHSSRRKSSSFQASRPDAPSTLQQTPPSEPSEREGSTSSLSSHRAPKHDNPTLAARANGASPHFKASYGVIPPNTFVNVLLFNHVAWLTASPHKDFGNPPPSNIALALLSAVRFNRSGIPFSAGVSIFPTSISVKALDLGVVLRATPSLKLFTQHWGQQTRKSRHSPSKTWDFAKSLAIRRADRTLPFRLCHRESKLVQSTEGDQGNQGIAHFGRVEYFMFVPLASPTSKPTSTYDVGSSDTRPSSEGQPQLPASSQKSPPPPPPRRPSSSSVRSTIGLGFRVGFRLQPRHTVIIPKIE
ncbi:hypothetical protein JAAARDRAFT_200311 [Jaapia argillacea MUCL 33604]|uniref:Uncharacterized protein n=1 Tax=Jaapia argillacea MUCL 33604 TaxID=933084 RepID=A0A067P8D1_9AGAM|nr:hypothetical protein JAAARDRAFT_200311 [Jaapia argillacea MUCL 33604]